MAMTKEPPRFGERWWGSLAGIVSNEKRNVRVD